MRYSPEDIKRLVAHRADIDRIFMEISDHYIVYRYQSDLAKEHAIHGFLRRLDTLRFCIDNIFSILPPDKTAFPSSFELMNVTVYLQAFVFNAFGCLDNLAWIWKNEKKLELNKKHVGLGKKYTSLRKSFSDQFNSYLTEMNDWFEHIENLRHALAHRIPLYIPPYVIKNSELKQYDRIQDLIAEADKRFDSISRKILETERLNISEFIPIMKHSFEENSPCIPFHKQIIVDYLTIGEIGDKILEELKVNKF